MTLHYSTTTMNVKKRVITSKYTILDATLINILKGSLGLIWKYFAAHILKFIWNKNNAIYFIYAAWTSFVFLCPYCNNQQTNHAHLVIFDQLKPKFGLIWLKRFVTCKYHSCNLDHKDHLLKFLKLSSVKNVIFLNIFTARYQTISGRIPNLA